MNDGMYRLFMSGMDLLLWDGDIIGRENLPQRGPAIFISNHLDATGPIAAFCALPFRLHPWTIANMMDRELAPAYLQMDFVERQLHFKAPLSGWIARFFCKITIPLFNSLGCIPVYRGDYARLLTTYNISMDYLRQEKFLVIFPEDNSLPMDPLTRMQPFQHSFVRLAEMYYAETGKCLEFFPVAVHASKYLAVGRPAVFNPHNHAGMERWRIKKRMEDSIQAMYLQLEGGNTSGLLVPEFNEDTTRDTT